MLKTLKRKWGEGGLGLGGEAVFKWGDTRVGGGVKERGKGGGTKGKGDFFGQRVVGELNFWTKSGGELNFWTKSPILWWGELKGLPLWRELKKGGTRDSSSFGGGKEVTKLGGSNIYIYWTV